ncbi:hypothetical protein [Neorhodopirellula pilleata]|uniref:Uncharacterized protein n=1 Tax=Neorhodopirellula pilleata TaxID=2714738 RepID=A0A5C5ZV65_9BACT|nr:hypothetical protein [Neorhodopirellula pilleata]TWT91405.1 hypothetical protein Pla100_52550 [Neorhodopirellula pilleata]TWT91454.1 hypothetical protein Pla100_53040 [Neorhodopirellula pilleata]
MLKTILQLAAVVLELVGRQTAERGFEVAFFKRGSQCVLLCALVNLVVLAVTYWPLVAAFDLGLIAIVYTIEKRSRLLRFASLVESEDTDGPAE